MRSWRIFALSIAVLEAGCATRTYDRGAAEAPLRGVVERPLYDLSLMRDAPPPLLLEAMAHPFELSGAADCASVTGEIAALDAMLGPDIDRARADDEERIDAGQILTGVITSAWSLPYRSIVRRLSGADRRERRLREAILAGMVRRGFLKGWAHRSGCASPSPPGPPD
jgi:hypothetical protein